VEHITTGLWASSESYYNRAVGEQQATFQRAYRLYILWQADRYTTAQTDFVIGIYIIFGLSYHIWRHLSLVFSRVYHILSALYYVDIGACVTLGNLFFTAIIIYIGECIIRAYIYSVNHISIGHTILSIGIIYFIGDIIWDIFWSIYLSFYLSIFYLAIGNILEAILYLWTHGIFIRIWDHILILLDLRIKLSAAVIFNDPWDLSQRGET
jgi:hypothetical protein